MADDLARFSFKLAMSIEAQKHDHWIGRPGFDLNQMSNYVHADFGEALGKSRRQVKDGVRRVLNNVGAPYIPLAFNSLFLRVNAGPPARFTTTYQRPAAFNPLMLEVETADLIRPSHRGKVIVVMRAQNRWMKSREILAGIGRLFPGEMNPKRVVLGLLLQKLSGHGPQPMQPPILARRPVPLQDRIGREQWEYIVV